MSGQSRQNFKRDGILIAVLVVIAAGLITYLATTSSSEDPAQGEDIAQGAENQGNDLLAGLARRTPDDPLAMGEPDAPVTMLVYSDYRCPFCAKFSQDTQPTLVDRYVESGVLRLEWRDLPIFGDESMDAARAGRAAAEQGKFWEYNDAVYADAPGDTSHPDMTPEILRGYAEEVGLDLEQFEADMASDKFDDEIMADLNEASGIGASSTPTFLINGTPVLGAQPLEVFTNAIEQAADQA